MMLNLNPLPKFVRKHKRFFNYYICVPLIAFGIILLCLFFARSPEPVNSAACYDKTTELIYAIIIFGASFSLWTLHAWLEKKHGDTSGAHLPPRP